MISALIVERDLKTYNTLESLLHSHCPQISLWNNSDKYSDAIENIKLLGPDLVFFEFDILSNSKLNFKNLFDPINFELIAISRTSKYALQAFNCCASGYLIKPIQVQNLISSVLTASKRVNAKKRSGESNPANQLAYKSLQQNEVIGIPTLEGYEFIPVKKIIRCEGMQKCTRVITTEKTDLISSYSLGEFIKRLEPFGFYSPHKSHLINLSMVRKYHKEGSIYMKNGTWIPVSKRRKKDFLNHTQHI